MIYIPHFFTVQELNEVGVTKEQLQKLFHYEDESHILTTEDHGDVLQIQVWAETSGEFDFDREFAKSYL